MVVIIYIIGLVFLISGLLSVANITNVGLNYVSLTKIHTLPYLNAYPSACVYVVLGLLVLVIAYLISRRK